MTAAIDGRGILDAIKAAPDDDFPRLAYADWLEEDAQSERAEFVRWAVRICSSYWKRRADEKTDPWVGANLFPDSPHHLLTAGEWTWHRGFVESVKCPLAAWLAHGPAVVRAHPVTRAEVTDREPWEGRSRGDLPSPDLFGWWSAAGSLQPACDLPPALLTLLDADPRRVLVDSVKWDSRDYTGGVFFGSPEGCALATSAALIAWAKLPPEKRGHP